jgi:protein tyrosine/serine phosphatase
MEVGGIPVPRPLSLAFTALVAMTLIVGPWWYKREHDRHSRNLHVVEEGVLYRSGQLDLEGLKRVVRDHGIRTIISLRDGDRTLDQDEEDWAPYAGANYIRIPPRAWQTPDGTVPAEEGLKVFREVISDPANHPVLIHCFAGIHRTGAYCAVYRMDFQGWSNHDAIAEMRALGYSTLDGDKDVLGFLEHYRPQGSKQILTPP